MTCYIITWKIERTAIISQSGQDLIPSENAADAINKFTADWKEAEKDESNIMEPFENITYLEVKKAGYMDEKYMK